MIPYTLTTGQVNLVLLQSLCCPANNQKSIYNLNVISSMKDQIQTYRTRWRMLCSNCDGFDILRVLLRMWSISSTVVFSNIM